MTMRQETGQTHHTQQPHDAEVFGGLAIAVLLTTLGAGLLSMLL